MRPDHQGRRNRRRLAADRDPAQQDQSAQPDRLGSGLTRKQIETARNKADEQGTPPMRKTTG
ncbi:hypothetical protein D3C76_1721850 [compost metagenome]